MSWSDVVGSVAITMYGLNDQQRWQVINDRGVDLTPATRRLRIEADPYGTLAYLTLMVHPEVGVVLDQPPRGVEVEFCYSVRSIQADRRKAEAAAAS